MRDRDRLERSPSRGRANPAIVRVMHTTRGDLPDADLIIRRDVVDVIQPDYQARVTTTEACARDCPGDAHRTGIATGDGCFCPFNIRRDVQVDVIKATADLAAIAAALA